MRSKLAVVLLLVLLSRPAAGGEPGEGCRVVPDPSGDVRSVPALVPSSTAAVDVTGFVAYLAGYQDQTHVVVELALADVGAALPLGADAAYYRVAWSAGGRSYQVDAFRGDAWSFSASSGTVDVDSWPVDAVVDVEAGTIRWVLPTLVLGAERTLVDVHATAEAVRATGAEQLGAPVAGTRAVASDVAPSGSVHGTATIALDRACASPSDPETAICPLLDDAAGDVDSIASSTTAVDVRGLSAGVADDRLLIELLVDDLDEPLPDGADAARYAARFDVSGRSYEVVATRTRTGWTAHGEELRAGRELDVTLLTTRTRVFFGVPLVAMPDGGALYHVSAAASAARVVAPGSIEIPVASDEARDPSVWHAPGAGCGA